MILILFILADGEVQLKTNVVKYNVQDFVIDILKIIMETFKTTRMEKPSFLHLQITENVY